MEEKRVVEVAQPHQLVMRENKSRWHCFRWRLCQQITHRSSYVWPAQYRRRRPSRRPKADLRPAPAGRGLLLTGRAAAAARPQQARLQGHAVHVRPRVPPAPRQPAAVRGHGASAAASSERRRPRRRRVGTPPGRCCPVAARQCRQPPPVDHGVAAVRRHAGLLRQRQSDRAPLGIGCGARDAPSRRRRGLEDGRHVHDTAGGGGSAAGGGGRRAVAGRTDRQTDRQTLVVQRTHQPADRQGRDVRPEVGGGGGGGG